MERRGNDGREIRYDAFEIGNYGAVPLLQFD